MKTIEQVKRSIKQLVDIEIITLANYIKHLYIALLVIITIGLLIASARLLFIDKGEALFCFVAALVIMMSASFWIELWRLNK